MLEAGVLFAGGAGRGMGVVVVATMIAVSDVELAAAEVPLELVLGWFGAGDVVA